MNLRLLASFACLLVAGSACSSGGPVKSQAYAKLSNSRAFEYDFATVWGGIERAMAGTTISSRNPSEADDVKLRELQRRRLETAWIYSQSRDKYQEYKLNGFPKKQYLQTRIKFEIDAESKMGGTQVTVRPTEEIERLRDDGSSAGYSAVAQIDTSRTNELLDRIGNAILSGIGSDTRSNSAD